MKIGILGTGMVGRALGTCFTGLGHEVMLGGRSGESGAEWAGGQGHHGAAGTFAEAADFADLAVIAVQGGVALDVAETARKGLAGKTLIDVTNPLDFSQGFPPRLIDGLLNDTSLGEALQAALPQTRVVKALNTMSNMVMVNPGALAEPTEVFVAGEDAEAKAQVISLLGEMGWEAPVDLGGIAAARGLEAWLLFWTRALGPMGGDGMFNLRLVRAKGS